MVVRLGFFIALLCLSLNAFAKGFTAQVDRVSVGISDHIQLVLTLADANGSRPDMSALDKDFTILQRSQSSNMKIVNGVVSQEIKWVYLLSPNRKGTLTIPSFISGNYKSASITIEVGDALVSQSTTDDVLLEVEVKPLNPYVKGQAIYTQRLSFAKQLVNNASLEQPKLAEGEAEIIFLGSSNPRHVQRNGRRYQMIERYYSVFSNNAGELTFAPSVFRGSVADNRQQPNGFNMPMFNTGKRVTAYSSKASLTIAAQPKDFTGSHWLPSSQLSLDMTWSQPPDTLQAGEPVTVTIMLMAEGLKAETLPEVQLAWPSSIKTYPEKPEFRTDKRANGLVGLRQEKVVLVANQNGEFQVPAIEVPWWNTVTNQQEVERIDGFLVNVAGTTQSVVSSKDVSLEPQQLAANDNSDTAIADIQPKQKVSVFDAITATYNDIKKHIPVTLALLSLILTLLAAIYLYITKPNASGGRQQLLASVQAELAKACNDQDTKTAIALLPKWADLAGIYPATLAGIKGCEDKLLAKEVTMLSQASYSQSPQAWNGEALLLAVKQFSYSEKAENSSGSLIELHPLH